MTVKPLLTDTGERMIPEFHHGGLIYAEHMTRYAAATAFVKNKTILDIASGSGYGSHLLAEHAKRVVGVDISAEAVAYANKHFAAKNIEFLEGSATNIPVADSSMDAVVTFETIEHVDKYEIFLKEIKRVLKKDGIAIVSTPNDLEFAEGNHFHLHEFEYNELRSLLKKHFKHVESYFQATWKAVAIGRESDFTADDSSLELKLVNYAPVPRQKFLYFYLVCSDYDIVDTVTPVAALGEHYSERQFLATQADTARVKNELIEQRLAFKALTKHAESMRDEIARLQQTVVQERATIVAIEGSKAYKVSRKLSHAAHTLRKPK